MIRSALVIAMISTATIDHAWADPPTDATHAVGSWLTAMHDADADAAARITTTPFLLEACGGEATTADAVHAALVCTAKAAPFTTRGWTVKSAELTVVTDRALAALSADYSKERRATFKRFVEAAANHVVLRARVPLEKPTGKSCRNFELLMIVDGARIRAVMSAPLIKVC